MDEVSVLDAYSEQIEKLGATELVTHYKKQKELEKTINDAFLRIEAYYQEYGQNLKNKLKELLREKIDLIQEDTRLTLFLVDIQNDFVLKGFALYAPGGENTIYSNMALLDALKELIEEDVLILKKINIITSQDAHVFKRSEESQDAKIIEQAYGKEIGQALLQKEQHELQDFNPIEGKFGLHCICGTIGAAISMPIEERLTFLQSLGLCVERFGKITFSAPESGIKLKEGHKLDKSYLSVYEEPGLPFLKYFDITKTQILVSGICGDICVKYAAEDLAYTGGDITVIDPCIHYLVISPFESPLSHYQKIKFSVLHSYDEAHVKYQELTPFRSNPECRGDELEELENLLQQLPKYDEATPETDKKAYEAKQSLLHSLEIIRKKYLLNLLCANSIQREKALELFKQECETEIRAALPYFEKDIPWMMSVKLLLTKFLDKILHMIGMGPATPRFFQSGSFSFEASSPSTEKCLSPIN